MKDVVKHFFDNSVIDKWKKLSKYEVNAAALSLYDRNVRLGNGAPHV